MTEFRKRVAIITAVILMLQTTFGIFAGFGTTESVAAGDNSSGQYTFRFTIKVLESPEDWSHADYVIMGQGNNGRSTELDVIKEEAGSDFRDKINKTYKDENSAGWFDSGNIDCKDCFPSVVRLDTIFGTKTNELKYEVYTWKAEVTLYINDKEVKNEEVTIEQTSAYKLMPRIQDLIGSYSVSVDDDAFPRIVDIGIEENHVILAEDLPPGEYAAPPTFFERVEFTPVDQYGVRWDGLREDDYLVSESQLSKVSPGVASYSDSKDFKLEGDYGLTADGHEWEISSYDKKNHDGVFQLRYDRGGIEKDDEIDGLTPTPVTVREEFPITFKFSGYEEAGDAKTTGSIFTDGNDKSDFGVGSLFLTGGIALVVGCILGMLIMYLSRRKKVAVVEADEKIE